MRDPIAAKTHYPSGPVQLQKEIEEVFHHELGPGATPLKHQDVEHPISGIIVPHGALHIAGPTATWGYKALAEQQVDTDLFIIIGQAQSSQSSGITTETFMMPNGEVRVDQNMGRALIEKGNIALNVQAHNEESIIETQLPFLQYIRKSAPEKIKLLPILVNHETNIDELVVDVKEALVDQAKKAAFIFVTNFTPYGRAFKYVPFTQNVQESIANLDKQLIDALKNYDSEAFEQVVHDQVVPISGHAALTFFFKYFNQPQVTLEAYNLSGDVTGEYDNTVSFASFSIRS